MPSYGAEVRRNFSSRALVPAIVLVCASQISTAAAAGEIKLSVSNPTDDDWREAPVVVALPAKVATPKSVKETGGGEGGAHGEAQFLQVDDMDGDGKPDEAVFLTNLAPHASRSFVLSADEPSTRPASRAHTGMYLKTPTMKGFEGPGWESDRICYRIYWDARNATDVFCKTQPIMAMDAYASREVNYHRLSKWGADVLHVGPALGIGGFGAWIDGKVEKVSTATREFKIVSDGPYRAACDLIYTNWTLPGRKLNLTARMTIFAGQSWAECKLSVDSADHHPVELVAGFVKHGEDTTLIRDEKTGILGRWGNQALGDGEKPKGGNLGMGVCADYPRQIAAAEEDAVNDFLRLKPGTPLFNYGTFPPPNPTYTVSYRYVANWFREPQAAKSAEEFRQLLLRVQRLKPVVWVEQEQKLGKPSTIADRIRGYPEK